MTGRTTFVCSCEDSMAPDLRTLGRACAAGGDTLRTAEHLCRSQLDRFLAALGEGAPVTVACTQEAPLFQQEAEAAGFTAPLAFANIREAAGWSTEGAQSGPKMAALLAMAALPAPETPLVSLASKGVALILGRDAAALTLAERLKDRLDLTVLLTGEEPVQPLARAEYPVLRGRARAATGWLGAFEVSVDGAAAASPASRDAYRWGTPKDGTTSQCDLILDLTGRPPLFPAHETRQGYLRATPGDAAALEKLAATAAELVGEFDKPRFITFEPALCAHGRNKRTGCTRCLDLCPTGAITPGKDSVLISAEICAGCGSCAAVCPTGAATYALPTPAHSLARLRTLLLAYGAAGGEAPTLLLHSQDHGAPLLDALARHGEGLPARTIPLAVNEVSQLDLATLAAAFAWGAAGVRLLLPARRGHGTEGVFRNLGYLDTILAGLGLGLGLAAGPARLAAIETDDPFTLAEALAGTRALSRPWQPAEFLPLGTPREVLRQALRALHQASGTTTTLLPMPEQAPLGAALVKAEGCTLCLACTMACPTGAFSANPDRPQLAFLEDACVQCGLCVATCPERVITLAPRVNFAPEAAQPQVVKQEEPFLCTRCAKPFGTASSIARVKQKLAASGHWMFQDPARLAVLELCEDCRAIEATTSRLDPYAGPERPNTITGDDYRKA